MRGTVATDFFEQKVCCIDHAIMNNNRVSELVRLQDLEEILNLETAVFRHVGAVHAVLNAVVAEFGTKGVWAQMLCDFRVVGSAEFAEAADSVILSDFEYHHGSVGQMFNERQILRKDALVHIVELFNNRS